MKILNSMVFALSLRPCHSPFSLGNVSTPYIYAIKYSIFHTDKMHAWLWFIFLFAPFAALQKRRQGAEEDEERKKRSHTLNAVTIKRGNSNANWIYLPEISFSIVHLSEFLNLSLSLARRLINLKRGTKKICIACTRKPERCKLIRYYRLPPLHIRFHFICLFICYKQTFIPQRDLFRIKHNSKPS